MRKLHSTVTFCLLVAAATASPRPPSWLPAPDSSVFLTPVTGRRSRPAKTPRRWNQSSVEGNQQDV